MRLSILSGVILGLFIFGSPGVLLASEVDELRAQAKALRQEAAVLAQQGKKEEAERLARKSVELLEFAQRIGSKTNKRGEKGNPKDADQAMRSLMERLDLLRTKARKLKEAAASEKELARVRDQIAATEQELKKIQAHRAERGEIRPEFRAQAEKLEAASRRIHHLRVAAANLKMAEVYNLARQLHEKADAMEKELQEAKKRMAGDVQKAHGGEFGPEVVRELRAEIERLSAEVKELRQKVEKP